MQHIPYSVRASYHMEEDQLPMEKMGSNNQV